MNEGERPEFMPGAPKADGPPPTGDEADLSDRSWVFRTPRLSEQASPFRLRRPEVAHQLSA